MPFGASRELALLLVVVVRRVIGRDEVDRAVRTASCSAATSSAVRSGGFIFAFVS